MFWSNKNDEKPSEDEHTFIKRIREEIILNTCQTSGIYVFEHDDDSNLDDQEQKILENLRKAHEDWHEKNPRRTAIDRDRNGVDIERGTI